MSIIANTFTRFGAQGLRERLSNVIYNISPEDTPVVSMSRKGNTDQTLFEWQTDELAATDTGNAHLEGDDIAAFPAVDPTVRVGNHTQISRKLVIISGTLDAVNKAGRRTELAYQVSKRGRELKRDMEGIVNDNIGGAAGGLGTARQTATLGAWLKTNTDFDAGGSDPVYVSGVPGAARVDSGSTRPFTEVILKAVVQSGYTEGAKFSNLVVGPFNKSVVSGFAGVVTRNFDMSNVSPRPTAVIASIDVYVHDFGVLKVMPNRFMRERDAYFLDPEFMGIQHLRGFRTIPLAKTGDAEKRMLLVEWGLEIKNEAALGAAFDLDIA